MTSNKLQIIAMKTKLTILFILCLGCMITLNAQDITNVDVKNLSDAQIQQIISEVESRGLTMDQAIALAQTRGASPTQINDLRRRIQDLQKGKQGQNPTSSIANPEAQTTQSSKIMREAFTEKAEIEATTKNKSIFGFNLFNNQNLTFEPSINIPTPAGYVLGIGDEIFINIWGASQQSYQLIVKQNGAIHIDDIGPVFVSGLSLENAERRIKNRLTAIYAGMRGDNPTTFSQISLGNLRAIKINIIGEVNVPGTYNLPSTATAFNALYLSGGPNENGSFRNIQLIRNGKIIQVIDVYDFILKAEMTGNAQLRDQDILFVPTYQNRVSVEGAFKRNALFELTNQESLADLIQYAGNFSDEAYKSNVNIVRIKETEKEIITVATKDFAEFRLQNGDEVSAGSINDVYKNKVTIAGSVNRPGEYEWKPDLKLSSLIIMADSLTEDAFKERAVLTRVNEDLTERIISIDIAKVISGMEDITLLPQDRIEIKSHFELKSDRYITVSGEVNTPGRFDYYDNLTLGEALFFANGLNDAADTTYVEVSRVLDKNEMSRLGDKLAHIYTMKIPRNLSTNLQDLSFKLEVFDQINVRRAPNYKQQGTVYVVGEVLYGGSFSLRRREMRISELISLSGGLTKYAYAEGASFERTTEDLGYENVAIDLNYIISNPNSGYDLILRDGDRLKVPRMMQTVKVSGAVQNPVSITYSKEVGLKYYINQAGGYSDLAMKRKVYVKYPNGKTATTTNFIFKNYPEIKPGCEIIVPQKEEKQRIDNSGKWMAWSSVIASLAVAFATIFKN
ncbi:MAG: sugar transporter [Bacteroidetes bacterium]|nr:sugar transporter [Bacteroidota bacterium]